MARSCGRGAGWIDRKVNFLVKFKTEDGVVFMLRNIQEGPQPADSFVIPVSYKKFNPRRLLEQLKHSDVLGEPAR